MHYSVLSAGRMCWRANACGMLSYKPRAASVGELNTADL
jgi:hypothetical protein